MISVLYTQRSLFSQELSKQTQSKIIEVGDLMRTEMINKTELGNQINETMQSGEIVSPELMSKLIALGLKNCNSNIIISNYPRTLVHKSSFIECLASFDIQVEKIWHLKLINSSYVAEKALAKNKDLNNNKYEVTIDFFLERIKKSKAIAEECLNLWVNEGQLIEVEVDYENEANIEQFFTKIIDMHSRR